MRFAFERDQTARSAADHLVREGLPAPPPGYVSRGEGDRDEWAEQRAEIQDGLDESWGGPSIGLLMKAQAKGTFVGTAALTVAGVIVGILGGVLGPPYSIPPWVRWGRSSWPPSSPARPVPPSASSPAEARAAPGGDRRRHPGPG